MKSVWGGSEDAKTQETTTQTQAKVHMVPIKEELGLDSIPGWITSRHQTASNAHLQANESDCTYLVRRYSGETLSPKYKVR
jgi:hypothetical protein